MMERRGVSLLLVALTALVSVAVMPQAAQADPQNPSDGQIHSAQRDKAQRAKDVGRLQAEVAQAAGQIQRLNDSAELAGERYNKAFTDYQTAQRKAATAKARVVKARKQVTQARASVGKFARQSYIYGSTIGPSTALLDANGPSDFIERAGLLQAAGERHTDVLGKVQLADVQKSNADSAARAAVAAAGVAKAKAAGAKRTAEAKVSAAREQMATLTANKTKLEGELVEAKARLSGLLTARQAYLKWKHHQEVLARQRAAALARAKRQARERAAKLREQQRLLLLQQQQQQQQGPPQGEPVKQQDPPQQPAPPTPPQSGGGGWSAAKGQAVVQQAEQWLGTPYAWSGGTASGPSYGTPPDEGVLGFDCSGLALFSWAQEGISLPHFSGYQYESGSHPSLSNLMPGDLLFWSYDGTPSTIHHVAIYIGNNQVIEAPESGEVIKIVPIWYDGLVGATRPGT